MDKGTLCDLCSTFVYSGSVGDQRRSAKGYIAERLVHPDEGSIFDKKLGKLKHLLRIPVVNGVVTSAGLWYLQRQGYDALMLDLEGKVIGHTAFQIHNDASLHIFSVEVLPRYQGYGLAKYMVDETLKEARKRKMKKMRIGGGKSEATNRIHQNLAKRTDELGILAHEGNWIDILYQPR